MNDDRPELSPRMLEYAAERTRAMGRLCEAAGMEFTDDCTLMGVAEQTAQRFARAEELLESTKAQLKRTRDNREALEREIERMKQAFSDLAFQELASSITDVRVRKALEEFAKVMGRDDDAEG